MMLVAVNCWRLVISSGSRSSRSVRRNDWEGLTMVISGILRLLGLPHPPIALPYGFLSRSLESGAWLYPRILCILPLGVIIIMRRGFNRVICHRWGGTGCREALVCFLPHYGASSLRRYREMRAAGICASVYDMVCFGHLTLPGFRRLWCLGGVEPGPFLCMSKRFYCKRGLGVYIYFLR